MQRPHKRLRSSFNDESSKRKLKFLPVQSDPVSDHASDHENNHENDHASVHQKDNDNDEDSEEDYMKMTIHDVPKLDPTYTERRQQTIRQQELKSRTKAPLIIQREKLQKGLDTSLIPQSDDDNSTNNVALSIMKKMGFIPGQALGKSNQADNVNDPLRVALKYDRAGIGMEESIRRQLQQQQDEATAQDKAQQESYLERVKQEQTEKKLIAQVHAAQKVCQELDVSSDPRLESTLFEHTTSSRNILDVPTIRTVNFLWRGLIIEQQTAAQEKLLRKRILDRPVSLDAEPEDFAQIEELTPEDFVDDELTEFDAIEPAQKLQVILEYLRQKYAYCFWCGCKYDDQADLNENCPGINEVDHE
ncbi:hypothetical protein V1512DRAFT_276367 [Lipomyces arxii]|uniref:uncharacterized protein n=1 Tax=Lipomyces arxii TaxID=56418 RepID=UPI0034CFACE3